MNNYEKLLSIQSELKCAKSQYNKFGNYNYRSCEDILEALKPLLAKYKAVVFISDSLEHIGERFYVKATVTFADCEKPETTPITVTAYAREEESKKGADGSQITGASSSYARKYALNGLFDIDDTKDSDTTNDGKGQAQKPPVQQQPAQQPAAVNYRSEFIKLCKEKGLDVVQCAAQYHIDKQTTQAQYKVICEMIKSLNPTNGTSKQDDVLSMADIQ